MNHRAGARSLRVALRLCRAPGRGVGRDAALWLRFSDGAEGEVDLAPELEGEVFEPLRDAAVFAQVRVDPEVRTIAWPNGADLAPEFLKELLSARAAA